MAVNPQTGALFVTRLPREIRDAIYLELWRAKGLRQHIFWHDDSDKDPHFCLWACTTEFQVNDELQQDIEQLRSELNIPLGQNITRRHDSRAVTYGRRLQSPWINHWACGERAENEYGITAVRGYATSESGCWKKKKKKQDANNFSISQSEYISMLLSCKLISAECLESIYSSTTFIFTDMLAIQRFFTYCSIHPLMERLRPFKPMLPAVLKYTRNLEFSFAPNFPLRLHCANIDLPGIDSWHEVYDFHWLRLDWFQNLQSIKIWIAARSSKPINFPIGGPDGPQDFRGIKEFDMENLKDMLKPFKNVKSLTLSTPLSPNLGPQGEGYVNSDGISPVRLYKRSSGDHFHPALIWIQHDNTYLDGLIHTSIEKEVRLGLNGGAFRAMREI